MSKGIFDIKPKVIVILGPTASGKSSLAVKIAKKIGGEIISADSRQVYKNLNIGTGKITEKEMRCVPHFGLDIIHPKKKFNVVDYKKYADKKIKEILSRGNVPIICGGTGFYIDAVVNGIVFPEVKANLKLRKELEKKSLSELLKILKKLDESRVKTVDVKNKVRLIRAIEIAQALGKVPKITKMKPLYDFVKIGITLPFPELEKKIKTRVKKMFKAGLFREIAKLKKSGVSDKRFKEFGFEYDNPTIDSVILGSVQYAKRQMTWFKRDKEIIWIRPPFSFSKNAELLELVKSQLRYK